MNIRIRLLSPGCKAAVVLIVLHVVAAAGLAFLLLWWQVDEVGLAREGRIRIGPVMEPPMLGLALVPTLPLALIEAWSIYRPRLLGAGVVAALLAAAVHTWIGMSPVTLRFGSTDPVARLDVGMGLTWCALILVIYLIEVLGLVVLAVLLRRLANGPAQ